MTHRDPTFAAIAALQITAIAAGDTAITTLCADALAGRGGMAVWAAAVEACVRAAAAAGDPDAIAALAE